MQYLVFEVIPGNTSRGPRSVTGGGGGSYQMSPGTLPLCVTGAPSCWELRSQCKTCPQSYTPRGGEAGGVFINQLHRSWVKTVPGSGASVLCQACHAGSRMDFRGQRKPRGSRVSRCCQARIGSIGQGRGMLTLSSAPCRAVPHPRFP